MLPLFGIWPMWKWSLKRAKKAMSLGMACWAAMSSRSPCPGWVKLGSPRALMTQTAAMVPTPRIASWDPPLFSTSAARRGWGKYKRKRGDFLSRPTKPTRKPWCIQICFHKRWFDSVNKWIFLISLELDLTKQVCILLLQLVFVLFHNQATFHRQFTILGW